MEIRNLITFQQVYLQNSFTKAAVILGYTQSAVTMQIKQLEEELGVRLFDRIGKTVRITDQGIRLIAYAEEMVRTLENARVVLSSDTGTKGMIRIGILDSVCTSTLPLILRSYHDQYPEVATVIKIGTLDELSVMLNANEIDLLWTFDTDIRIPEWHRAFVYESNIEIICSPSHEFQRDDLHLSDLAGESFILTEQSCSYRRIFEERMLALGHRLDIFLEIGNTEMIKKFIEQNLGIAVLPRFSVEDELKNGKLSSLQIKDFHLEMQGQIFHHKNKWVSLALASFLREIENSLSQ
jgi:DNA-binding transcriptional LysR family regulator